jgi:hypothetical protein
MEVTCFKKTRNAMRKEEISQIKIISRPTPQRKLIDSVGLTLKEYFAKTDQKYIIKSYTKMPENYLGKIKIKESFEIALKSMSFNRNENLINPDLLFYSLVLGIVYHCFEVSTFA